MIGFPGPLLVSITLVAGRLRAGFAYLPNA